MGAEPTTKPLMTKAALLQRIEAAYSLLLQSYKLDSKDKNSSTAQEGKWSVKDTLAHIAGWEQILVRFHLSGQALEDVIQMEGAQYRVTSFDEINEHLYHRFAELTHEQVEKLLADSHNQVLEALEAFPEDQLHLPHPRLSVGEAASLNWIDYIAANTYEHYEEHLSPA
jgi:hypothetical protein